MLILLLLVVMASLIWLFAIRKQPVTPALRRVGIGFAVAFVCAALAVRAGPAVGLALVTVVLVAVWLRLRRRGDDGPGDDGRDPPSGPEPDPDPGPQASLRPERLDQDAFDRARAEWERELPKRG